MEGIQTFKGSWPWPWIRPYGIPSCITHRPLLVYQISLKSKKLFVDGRTDGRTDVRTDIFPPSNIIRSTFGSWPNKYHQFQKHLDYLIIVTTLLCVKKRSTWTATTDIQLTNQQSRPVGIEWLKHWHCDAAFEHVCPHVPIIALYVRLQSRSVFWT